MLLKKCIIPLWSFRFVNDNVIISYHNGVWQKYKHDIHIFVFNEEGGRGNNIINYPSNKAVLLQRVFGQNISQTLETTISQSQLILFLI